MKGVGFNHFQIITNKILVPISSQFDLFTHTHYDKFVEGAVCVCVFDIEENVCFLLNNDWTLVCFQSKQASP